MINLRSVVEVKSFVFARFPVINILIQNHQTIMNANPNARNGGLYGGANDPCVLFAQAKRNHILFLRKL
jgi:hypothetical protein